MTKAKTIKSENNNLHISRRRVGWNNCIL